MTTVYLVLGSCGDYYCESEHVVGVGLTHDDAELIAADADRDRWPACHNDPFEILEVQVGEALRR